MTIAKLTGTAHFIIGEAEGSISREALRDLAGRFGGIDQDASDEELIGHFSDKIIAVANRYPNMALTSAHFFP